MVRLLGEIPFLRMLVQTAPMLEAAANPKVVNGHDIKSSQSEYQQHFDCPLSHATQRQQSLVPGLRKGCGPRRRAIGNDHIQLSKLPSLGLSRKDVFPLGEVFATGQFFVTVDSFSPCGERESLRLARQQHVGSPRAC